VLAFASPLLALSILLAAPEGALTDKDIPDAHPIALRAQLDHQEITLGQSFALVIDVVHDPADTYSLQPGLAEALSKGSLELRGEPQIARAVIAADAGVAASARTTLTLPLADVASMKPSLPALDLDVQGPSGPRKLHLPEQALSVESLVAKEGEPNPEHAHHGPKPPEQITVRSYLWLWLLLAIAAVAAGMVAFNKYRKRAAEKAAEPPPPERPDSEAQRRLKDLRDRAPWSTGQGRAAIFELSEIVRTYLGKQLDFNAVDLTSEELLLALGSRAAPVPGLDLLDFAERIRWEDLVKFAKLEPTAAECVNAVESAGNLVEQTRSRMEMQRHADLAAAEKSGTQTVGTQTIGTPTNGASPQGGAR